MFQPTPAGRVIEGRNLTGGKLKWCQWGATAGGDDDQPDGQTARHSIDAIEKLTKSGQPWMVAAGFHRPHDPFLSPKKYFDLYPLGSLTDLSRPGKRHAAPATFAAGRRLCGRFQRVHGSRSPGIPAGLLCRRVVYGRAGWPVARHAGSIGSLGPHARHFHRRSWISPQRAQLVEQEHAVRTQLPRAVHRGRARREKRASLQLNGRTGGLIPHHRRLLRRSAPHRLAGQSLRPLLENPERKGKEAAFTLVTRGQGHYGQSVRTERWRYTQWSDGNAELYDELNDPQEVHDLSDDPAMATIIEELKGQLVQVGPFQSAKLKPLSKLRRVRP